MILSNIRESSHRITIFQKINPLHYLKKCQNINYQNIIIKKYDSLIEKINSLASIGIFLWDFMMKLISLETVFCRITIIAKKISL